VLNLSEPARLAALSIQKGSEPNQDLKPLPATAAQQISVPLPALTPGTYSVTWRAVSFVMLFQAAGIAIFIAIFGRRLETSLAAIRHLGQVTAVAGMALVAAHYVLEAANGVGGGSLCPGGRTDDQ
jgi:CopC domain